MATHKKQHSSDCLCSAGCMNDFIVAVDRAYKRIVPEHIRRQKQFKGFIPFTSWEHIKQAKSREGR